jgi:hypothetical protein
MPKSSALDANLKNLIGLCVGLAAAGCGNSDSHDSKQTPDPGASSAPAVSYWQDVEPILESHCIQCHQDGGIAPFALDNYDSVVTHANSIRSATSERHMPPWSAISDGSCGEFADSLALSAEQIQTLSDWALGGTPLGTPGVAHLPSVPKLDDAFAVMTPVFQPMPEGTALALHDEYRCFLLDAPTDPGFITAYEVNPGTPEIVHHLIAYLIDPAAPADGIVGSTNLDVVQALDAASPDRDGWPCYSGAGDGLNASAVPIVWAPGQGVVRFPEGSGVPVAPTDKIVVQVHYNLADSSNIGKLDQTQIKLQVVPSVEKLGIFVLNDPLLDSLQNDHPDTLPPGQTSYKYTWQSKLSEIGLDADVGAELHGIMPHMHGLGHRYEFDLQNGTPASGCAAKIDDWNFHWQRMYFYQTPYRLTPDSSIQVTCDYDTTSVTDPVLPGWGTQNEMCLATMYVTVPVDAFQQ